MIENHHTVSKDAKPKPDWRRFVRAFVGVGVGAFVSAVMFIIMTNPYGNFPVSAVHPPPLALADRFVYPSIIYARRFDSAVVGTSTSRLINPAELETIFDGRFMNLSMPAATAWEQTQVARLFMRETPEPRFFILGVDQHWCRKDADLRKITKRGFPAWLYDGSRWNDYINIVNVFSLELAGRVIGYFLGVQRARYPVNGYKDFTPPASAYDIEKAREDLWKFRSPDAKPKVPPAAIPEAVRKSWTFPAIPWMRDTLADLPPTTRKIILFLPAHIGGQPVPGTKLDIFQKTCKDHIVDVARQVGALVVDMRFDSPINREDSNYWDRLHYRRGLAPIITREIGRIADGGGSNEIARVLHRPDGFALAKN